MWPLRKLLDLHPFPWQQLSVFNWPQEIFSCFWRGPETADILAICWCLCCSHHPGSRWAAAFCWRDRVVHDHFRHTNFSQTKLKWSYIFFGVWQVGAFQPHGKDGHPVLVQGLQAQILYAPRLHQKRALDSLRMFCCFAQCLPQISGFFPHMTTVSLIWSKSLRLGHGKESATGDCFPEIGFC